MFSYRGLRLREGPAARCSVALSCLALLWFPALPGPAGAAETSETEPAALHGAGKLVVAGGAIRSSREEIWDRIFAERLPGRPVGIVSTASAEPESAGLPLAEELNRERGEGSAVPGVVYCQHHLERGRFGRLLVATLSEEFGQSRGFGVSEDSAVVVDLADGTATAIGARGAVFVDSSLALTTGEGGVSGVRLHFLARGDSVDLASGGLVPAPGREGSAASGDAPVPIVAELPDAWAPGAVREMIDALAAAGGPAEALAFAEGRELVLRRTPATRVWRALPEDEHATPWTVSGMEVLLRPR